MHHCPKHIYNELQEVSPMEYNESFFKTTTKELDDHKCYIYFP